MLTETQLERYADVLMWGLKTARQGKYRPGDTILIRYQMPARRLAEILYAKILAQGMHAVQRVQRTPDMENSFYRHANERQLAYRVPGDKTLYDNLNGSIFLHAPESITHLSDVDPAKIGRVAIANKYLRDIYNRREDKGVFSWTLCTFPTKGLARHARLSLKAYSEQIAKACFLNRKSPLSHWETIFKSATTLKQWLNRMKVKFYHIESENIDLEIAPGEKRRWIGISGHNIPSFELFLSPDWRRTRGVYWADQPSYRSGNYVKGVRLAFEKGAAIKIEARVGRNFVRKQLAMDKGANKLGEFSLTDKRFSKIDRFMANTLFDENFGGRFGNCHVALGSSYSATYAGDPRKLTKALKRQLGFNDSALHWDLVNTEKKRVTAHLRSGERKVIYENGRFLCD